MALLPDRPTQSGLTHLEANLKGTGEMGGKQVRQADCQRGVSECQLPRRLGMQSAGQAERCVHRRPLVLTWMALGSALFTSLLAFAATPGLGSLIGIVPAFIVIRLAFGLFTAPIYPTCNRMNANWIPLKNRARATGLANAGAGFGGAVSPILFSWMISRYGWRTSFLLSGIATAMQTRVP